MALKLRGYQTQAIEDVRASIRAGNRAPLLVMPTGSGKTATACEIIRSAVEKSKTVTMIAPRRQLVYQASDALNEYGVRHGVIMAGERTASTMPVQVASLDTLHARRSQPLQSDLIIVDEAHCVFGKKMRSAASQAPSATILGLTATPCRSDGRGLGEIYDDLILGPSISDLTDQGHLVPLRYYSSPEKIDLSDVPIQDGDYNQSKLDQKMATPKLVGGVVKNWLRLASDRQTVVFAVKRTHAKALQAEFQAAGVVADYIDGETPNDERKRILERIESGESRVIVSVDVLSYGWNSPAVSCAVLARPTKSIARYLQAVGRILRTYPGKEDAILIDHGEVVKELGFIDDPFPWSLDGEEKVQDRKEKQKDEKKPEPMECPKCHMMQPASRRCIRCGHDMTANFAEKVLEIQADLEEVKRKEQERDVKKWTKQDKQMFYSEMLGMAMKQGFQEGWAAHQYRERTGVWPRGLEKRAIMTTRRSTENWLLSRRIAYTKRLENAK